MPHAADAALKSRKKLAKMAALARATEPPAGSPSAAAQASTQGSASVQGSGSGGDHSSRVSANGFMETVVVLEDDVVMEEEEEDEEGGDELLSTGGKVQLG